jgi:uncharacterized membrane protein YcaP (DUF421 family)
MANKDIQNLQNSNERIELRSNNTRHFIDEEPPFIIRYGTIVIILLLLLLGAFTYFAFPEYH